jgi:hypothetical protein
MLKLLQAENFLIAYTGVVAVFIFILMIFFGGIFNSVNSLLYREVSFLISPNSATKFLTIPLFQLYNIHLILFSLLLSVRLHNRYSKIGAIYLLIASLFGLVLLKFPMDPRGISQSPAGVTHITIALMMALFIVISLLLLSKGLKKSKKFVWLSKLSFLVGITVTIFGFLTGLFAAFSLPSLVGLMERLPIGAFLIWIYKAATGLLKSKKDI